MIPFEVLDSLGDIHMMCENWKHFLGQFHMMSMFSLLLFFLAVKKSKYF